MKRCSNCTKTYDDDDQRFCTECGTPIAEMPTVSNAHDGTLRMGNEYETRRIAPKNNPTHTAQDTDEPLISDDELEILKIPWPK